jgi:hypothetical protein
VASTARRPTATRPPGRTTAASDSETARDQPPRALVGPRGAIRRSLVAWGWGQLATGDRRGWLLLALEAVALLGFALVAISYARGTSSGLVFVGGAAFVAVWAAQALHAERRARRRLEPLATDSPAGAAVELLWLAPIVGAAATAFWSLTGPATSPDDLLADYVDLWRTGRPAEASVLFAVPPDPAGLDAAWQRQSARLTNETIRAAAQAGATGGIDPADPWASVRWNAPDEAAMSAAAEPPNVDGRFAAEASVVRRETVRDSFLGLVATTTERLVPIDDLGAIRLRTVELPGPLPGTPPVVAWRIEAVQLLGESLGGS